MCETCPRQRLLHVVVIAPGTALVPQPHAAKPAPDSPDFGIQQPRGGSGTCWTSLSTVSAFSISQAAALKHVCKENHERLQTQSHCKLCRSNCTHTEIFSSAHSALHEHSSSTEQQRGHPVLTRTKATVLLPGRFNTQQKTILLKSQEKFQD